MCFLEATNGKWINSNVIAEVYTNSVCPVIRLSVIGNKKPVDLVTYPTNEHAEKALVYIMAAICSDRHMSNEDLKNILE